MNKDDNLENSVKEVDELIQNHYTIWMELGFTPQECNELLFSVFLTLLPKYMFLITENKETYEKVRDHFIDYLNKEPYEATKAFYKSLKEEDEED
jgi:L-rhamnose mutarotase